MSRLANPRLFKKRCRMAVQLLVSHGNSWHGFDPVRDVFAIKPDDLFHPGHDAPLKGTLILGYMGGGECPEWVDACPWDTWLSVFYWTYVVPKDFNGDLDELPHSTEQHKRDRLKYSAIAPGWRWRGGKAVKNKDKM